MILGGTLREPDAEAGMQASRSALGGIHVDMSFHSMKIFSSFIFTAILEPDVFYILASFTR